MQRYIKRWKRQRIASCFFAFSWPKARHDALRWRCRLRLAAPAAASWWLACLRGGALRLAVAPRLVWRWWRVLPAWRLWPWRSLACPAARNGMFRIAERPVRRYNTGRSAAQYGPFAACGVTRCATVSCLPPCLACACALASRCQGRQAWLLQSGRMPGACSADAARRGAAAATLYYYKAAHCNTNETHI